MSGFNDIADTRNKYTSDHAWGKPMTVRIPCTVSQEVTNGLREGSSVAISLRDLIGEGALEAVLKSYNINNVPLDVQADQATPATFQISLSDVTLDNVHFPECEMRSLGATVGIPVAHSLAVHDNTIVTKNFNGQVVSLMLPQHSCCMVEGQPVAAIISNNGSGQYVLLNDDTRPAFEGGSVPQYTHLDVYRQFDNGVTPKAVVIVSVDKQTGKMRNKEHLDVSDMHIAQQWCQTPDGSTLTHDEFHEGLTGYLHAQLNVVRHGSFDNILLVLSGKSYHKHIGPCHLDLTLKFQPLVHKKYANANVKASNRESWFKSTLKNLF